MRQFIIRRIVYAIITLFILSLTIFLVVRLTGDPVTLLASPAPRAIALNHWCFRVSTGKARKPVLHLSPSSGTGALYPAAP